MKRSKTLLCTVGTGNFDQLEESLFTPLKKSIRHGEWARVILLPSQHTYTNANLLFEQLDDHSIDIRPLAQPGQEENVDDCFAHFDDVIATLLREGIRSDLIVPDFTRGTKAMSAALVLAALRHGLPTLRYVSGEHRDSRGMVKPGTEHIKEFQTTTATASRVIDDAATFFRKGHYSAAIDLIEKANRTSWPKHLACEAEYIDQLAKFYSAWDRLDYQGAKRAAMKLIPDSRGSTASIADVFVPKKQVLDWIDSLAASRPVDTLAKAEQLRHILIDLFANGERRLRDLQFEDALLRAYRVLELIGQVRLFDKGFDSAKLPANDEKIIEYQEFLTKQKLDAMTEKKGKFQASRVQVTHLLDFLGDDFGRMLRKAADVGTVKANSRNHSILIHGFDSIAGSDYKALKSLYDSLLNVMKKDQPKLEDKLACARFPAVFQLA